MDNMIDKKTKIMCKNGFFPHTIILMDTSKKNKKIKNFKFLFDLHSIVQKMSLIFAIHIDCIFTRSCIPTGNMPAA
jgi:hypothetical protein